jgi:hypothetical protein
MRDSVLIQISSFGKWWQRHSEGEARQNSRQGVPVCGWMSSRVRKSKLTIRSANAPAARGSNNSRNRETPGGEKSSSWSQEKQNPLRLS